MEKKIQELESRIKIKDVEIQQLREELQWVYNSTTWRVGKKMKNFVEKGKIKSLMDVLIKIRRLNGEAIFKKFNNIRREIFYKEDKDIRIWGNSKYLLSIILIANESAFKLIEKSILNIQNQPTKSYEIIIIFKNSSNDLVEKIKYFTSTYRVKIYKLSTDNEIDQYIEGTRRSSGKYLCFLKPGDILNRDFVKNFSEVEKDLNQNSYFKPEIIVVDDYDHEIQIPNNLITECYGNILPSKMVQIYNLLPVSSKLIQNVSNLGLLKQIDCKHLSLSVRVHRKNVDNNLNIIKEEGHEIINIKSLEELDDKLNLHKQILCIKDPLLNRFVESIYHKRFTCDEKFVNRSSLTFLPVEADRYKSVAVFNDPLRVVLQVDSLDKGGLEMVVYNIAKGLSKSGIQVKVLVTGKEIGYFGHRLRDESFEVIKVDNDIKKLRIFLNEYRPNIINAHFSIFGFNEYKKQDIKIIYTVHNSYTWLNRSEIKLRKLIYKLVDCFVPVSYQTGEYFQKIFNIEYSKITFIPNGIDRELFKVKATGNKFNNKYIDKKLFINIASISNFKNQNSLVSLAQYFKDSNPDFHFLCIGRIENQEYYDYLKKRIKSLNLTNIEFIDFVSPEQLSQYYRFAHSLILPSIQEGCSNVVIEALTFGLPIIGTDTGSIREMIKDGLNGRIVGLPYKSVYRLNNESIIQLAKNDKQLNFDKLVAAVIEVGKYSKNELEEISSLNKKISNNYTNEIMIGRYKRLIENVMSSCDKNEVANIALNIISRFPNNNNIIFRPTIDWFVPIFQRPQQIAIALADSGNFNYFFSTHKGYHDQVDGIVCVYPNLFLTNDYEKITKINHPVYHHLLSTDLSLQIELINKFLSRGDKIIYEYIDEIHEDISGKEIPSSFIETHKYLLADERIYVIATADKLYQEVSKSRKNNFKLVTNGVSLRDFQSIDKGDEIPQKIKNIMRVGKPIIGYYGSLASWFDYDLVLKIAAIEKYEIVLLGYDYDQTLSKSGILNNKHIHYLGTVDYKLLPVYSKHFDVAIIPFLVNDITESTSPVKLFEYMALGKPIVTTNMLECRKYKSVLIGKNHNDFINKLHKALHLRTDNRYLNLLKKEAKENSWDRKTSDIIDLIKQGA